jgi:hypothetical protein
MTGQASIAAEQEELRAVDGEGGGAEGDRFGKAR